MNQSEISVVITGLAGAGKTTLAYIIEQALREAGFEVEQCDVDLVNRCIPEPFTENAPKCAAAIQARGTAVKIKTAWAR